MKKLFKSICILLAFFSSSAALATDSGWIISEADGQVSITRDGKAVYGAQGTKLQIGDVVRTGKGARAVLVRGEDFVIVSPERQVRIAKAKEKGIIAQAFQSVGNMISNVAKKNSPQPNMNQSASATVVKGYGRDGEKHTAEEQEAAMNTLTPAN